jgi:4-diphosphocytidyl-2-C-methyl-D-erythritol kinase
VPRSSFFFKKNGLFLPFKMIRFPNAKINIGLRVLRKRRDGFHDIETLFAPIGLCDALELVPAAGTKTSLSLTGLELDARPEENICYQAWELMHKKHGIPPVDMHLHKVIPAGAGLGGGSADAAYALCMLSDMFALALGKGEIIRLAAQLGSDCAFFVHKRPMLGYGRGEQLSELPMALPGLYLLLVNPGIHVPTALAYRDLKPRAAGASLAEAVKMPPEKWRNLVQNDFETPIFEKFPEIKSLKQKMYDNGAVFAQMSGSGSSVYGLFRGKPKNTASFGKALLWQGPACWKAGEMPEKV